MNEVLKKYRQMILLDSTECTSSQELEHGIIASTSQDGVIDQSGQQVFHANHSVQPEEDSVKQTKDTYCRTSLNSSESASQKQSLENRLRQLLDMGGSMIYTQKWAFLVMKLRQTLSLRALLVLRIYDHVYGGSQLVKAWE